MIFTTIERLDTDYAIYIDIDEVGVCISYEDDVDRDKVKIVADFICAAVRGAKP